MEDEGLNRQIFERAAAAGIQVLIVTADSVVSPIREYNDRNGFTIPFRITPRNTVDVLMHPRWFVGVILRYLATRGLPRYANMPVEMRDAITGRPARMVINSSLDWDGFLRLRKLWPNRLLLKGVMTAADARLAADHGVDGVVVSNHGGRNFDAAMATIDALPDIVDAVGHRIPVLLDSGIRRGSDVVKALALGARAVLAGRLPLYGAAVAGQAGVERALSILRNEFEVAMAFCGRSRAADIDRSILASE
jgi:isopentenyl diphosphate isomerase/L-lactate dehydrogenase-like FMN-dependent dehydrogenase